MSISDLTNIFSNSYPGGAKHSDLILNFGFIYAPNSSSAMKKVRLAKSGLLNIGYMFFVFYTICTYCLLVGRAIPCDISNYLSY